MTRNQDIAVLEGVERALGLAIRYASKQAPRVDDSWACQTIDEAVGAMQDAQAYIRADILRIEREERNLGVQPVPATGWTRTLAAAERRFWEGR